jgi:hypothetical protein
MQEAITKLGGTVLFHRPYSPDLAPSDFYHFGALTNAMTRFGSDDKFIEEIRWPRTDFKVA